MPNINDIPAGLRVATQIHLDKKQIALSEAVLADLGPGNNLAYTYPEGLIVRCNLEKTRWEWMEVDEETINKLPGSADFTYPTMSLVDGIDYSGRTFNFVLTTFQGEKGDNGSGIVSVTKTGTSGLIDTYTILFEDTTTATFQIANGAPGADATITSKTSGVFALPSPTEALPYDINKISVVSNINFLLPVTTQIGKTIIVIGDNAGNRSIVKAYADSSAKMFLVATQYISEMAIDPNKIYQFTYIGFGTGTNGEINGYWLIQEIIKNTNNLQRKIISPADFTSGVYTLVESDNNYTLVINNGTNNVTINIPNGLTSNFEVGLIQDGTGDVSVLGTSALKTPIVGATKIKGNNFNAFIQNTGTTNQYRFLGNIKV